jgi:tetratricopeptide (TPR) repeat protein
MLMVGFYQSSYAQKELQIIDSLKKEYAKTKSLTVKSTIAGELAGMFMSVNLAEADKWGNLALEQAEISRDREKIVEANTVNGLRFMSNSGIKENIEKSKTFFETALNIAQKSKLDKQLSESYLYLSRVYRSLSEYDKALSNTTHASSIAQSIKNDSLIGACYQSFGSCYFWKGDKIMALRNYFEAINIAEKIHNEQLIRTCNGSLINFYTSIKNFDKAVDYAFSNLSNSRISVTKDFQYYIITDLYVIGNIYSSQKKFDLAKTFYEQSIAKADSLKINIAKFQGYIGIFNMFLNSSQPQKALSYFNAHPEMVKVYNDLGYSYSIDYGYGYAYLEYNKLDSAEFFLNRAKPFMESQALSSSNISFKTTYAKFLEKKGDINGSIAQLTEALNISRTNKELASIIDIAKLLDSASQKIGNYKDAFYYTNLHTTLKDSLDKMSKEDEILQLQITDEEQRKERLLAEETERIKKRNSIQYLGIVMAIVVVFLGLVMMGLFRVSENTIRILGFFSFIMLFEFLFLVFKKSIYQFTHGEPWKDLTAMILMAAILVPLHHWLEHKVIHYLSSQEILLLKNKGRSLMPNFFRKSVEEL